MYAGSLRLCIYIFLSYLSLDQVCLTPEFGETYYLLSYLPERNMFNQHLEIYSILSPV